MFCKLTSTKQKYNKSTRRSNKSAISNILTSAQCPGPFLRSCANCFLKIYLIDGKLNCLNEKDISDLVMITGNLSSHHYLITLEDSPTSPKNNFVHTILALKIVYPMINVLPSQYHDVLTAFDVLIFARRDILFFQITMEVVSCPTIRSLQFVSGPM